MLLTLGKRAFGIASLAACMMALVPRAHSQTPEPTSTSTVSESEAARLHAEAGRAYYQADRYLEALREFQSAHELVPTPALGYNIARCHERLSQWKEAIQWYERYVAEATDPRDRAETLDKIALLKTKLGPDESPEGKYRARIEAGRKAYASGDYEGAIEEFKAAFDLKASPGALYNIAKSYEKMSRYEEAIDYFTQYLDLDPLASDRADVEETIRRLKKSLRERFQELIVTSDPAGGDIYLDDRNTGLQGQTNSRFKVTPGPHTIYLDLNGYEPIKRDFIMPDDKPLALDFKMKKLENVGFVNIAVNEEGARIFVDGAIVGLSPYKQKKALEAGTHQVQVEKVGFERWTGTVDVKKDDTATVAVVLKEYDAPVADETLTTWGRNLMLVGIIGGGLGVAGPFGYQKLIARRPHFEQLGPESTEGGNFYRGGLAEDDPNRRGNGELGTLKTIQVASIIAGSAFTAGGLAFFFYKWFRDEAPPPVTASLERDDAPVVTVDTVNVFGDAEGAFVGLGGRF